MSETEEKDELIVFDDEKDRLIDHDFDGIKEFKNPPPKWIMAIFYLTILWAVLYWAHYQTFDYGDLQAAEYDAEMASYQRDIPATEFDEANLSLLTDEASMTNGAELFVSKTCVTCHGANGEGNAIGPNLTDEYWINGGDISSVFKIVKYGVIAKGMTPFKDRMSDQDIHKVSSYIVNRLVGSNPENAKEPQGDKM